MMKKTFFASYENSKCYYMNYQDYCHRFSWALRKSCLVPMLSFSLLRVNLIFCLQGVRVFVVIGKLSETASIIIVDFTQLLGSDITIS